MSSVTMYTTPWCGYCHRLSGQLNREGIEFEVVDIEQDPALHARYLERIPVIALDGDELFDYFVDERALLARLRGSIVSER